jgi:flagellar basal body rod protein FlgG
MNDIFRIASIGMEQGQRQLESISQNAASASQPGYRRHVAVGRPFATALETDNARQISDPTAIVGVAPIAQQVDLHPGAMMPTGHALDLAIDDEDLFFAVTDGTQTWLTRSGSFRLNSDGILVGDRGLRVVGTQGDVHLPGSDVTVGADGSIKRQGVVVGTLQLFKPNDRESLQAAQGALLLASDGIQPVPAGVGRVRAGVLEASNTDSSREVLTLLTLSRQFEGLSRIVQSYDEVLGRAIQKLGES